MTINSLEALMLLRNRVIEDPDSVTDEELRAALQFAREQRMAGAGPRGAKKKASTDKKASTQIDLESILEEI